MGDSSYGVDLPRLKLAAVALGATGILGFTYWYLRRSAKSKNSLSNSNKTVSIDDAGETTAPEDLSPLQQAQDCKKHGNDAFKKGKYDEAIVWYNKAIEACPKESSLDLATFYQNRAAAYEQLKKWTSVINDCTTALDYNGKYEKALSRRARAYELMKDWELALDDITAVCLIQGFRNQNTLLLADRVLKELGKEHAAEAMSTRKPKLCSKQFIKTYFMSFPSDPVYQKLLAVDDTLGQGELKGYFIISQFWSYVYLFLCYCGFLMVCTCVSSVRHFGTIVRFVCDLVSYPKICIERSTFARCVTFLSVGCENLNLYIWCLSCCT